MFFVYYYVRLSDMKTISITIIFFISVDIDINLN